MGAWRAMADLKLKRLFLDIVQDPRTRPRSLGIPNETHSKPFTLDDKPRWTFISLALTEYDSSRSGRTLVSFVFAGDDLYGRSRSTPTTNPNPTPAQTNPNKGMANHLAASPTSLG